VSDRQSPEQLRAALRTMQAPPNGYAALPLGSTRKWWIGRHVEGSIALLVEETTDALVRTALLDVSSNLRCKVRVTDEEISATFTVIHLRDHSPAMEEYFVDLCMALQRWHDAEPKRPLGQIILQLASFFALLASPSRKSQLGLWAELLFILESGDPIRLLRCWHQHAEDRFDFSSGDERIEVKAGRGELRIHHFSEQQLREPGLRILVVSYLVEANADGMSVRDVLEEVLGLPGVTPDLAITTRDVAARTLGRDWLAASLERFDPRSASLSARLLDARQIPAIPSGYPLEIFAVEFQCNVENVARLNQADLAAGGLWRAASRARVG
jgi:hypothetical protein